jgi:hypothetical protein
VILICVWGPAGLALASALPMLVSDGIALTLTMQRSANVSLRRLLLHSVAPAATTAAAVFGVGSLMRLAFPVDNWRVLGANASVMLAAAVAGAYMFVLTPDSRSWLWGIATKLLSRWRRPSVEAYSGISHN